ncbi:MAG: Stp1/IreP family PP2C-type Ser/Thr phosphatase [Bdellovibrionota bacterium]
MELRAGFATDIGKRRTQNQDSFAALPEFGLFVVADGMGGHRGGEIASAMVTETVPKFVKEATSHKGWNPRVVLVEAIQAANAAIYERGRTHAELQGMGTTTTALIFNGNTLTIGHVGDSRCYFFRPHMLWQATRDHSLVAERLRAGLITREEAKMDRMKNIITRSVGFEPSLNVEIYDMELNPGDAFLVCSDGLSGLIDDPTMLKIVENKLYGAKDPNSAVKTLIDAANSNGGDDNITAILVEVVKTV